jgi:hypothetical protein
MVDIDCPSSRVQLFRNFVTLPDFVTPSKVVNRTCEKGTEYARWLALIRDLAESAAKD